MKQSEFNEAISDRWVIFKACLLFTFQKETAYFLNNWASVLSTTFYTIAMLIFINVLYGNVTTIVGYTKQEMLLFFLMGQATFYTTWALSAQNMQEFIVDVNRGDLDLILTKPIPALFYISIKRPMIFSTMIRDGIPPMLAVIFSIQWGALTFHIVPVFVGLLIFILGQICLHGVHFLATIPVIWLGESKRILKLFFDVEHFAGRFIPLEGFGMSFRFIFSVLIPVMVAAGFSTSVILEKSPVTLLIFALFSTLFIMLVRGFVWSLALRNYTSASS